MENKKMNQLVQKLNMAAKAYYQQSNEIMANFEYDQLYDELVKLEKETGIVLSNSPTVSVGYEVLENLPKEKHSQKMLSLDKTKDPHELQQWLGDKEGVLSHKVDGLTIVITYNNGTLVKAVTRGSGEIGEVVTSNARMFQNLPLTIPYQGEITLRGEAFIKYSDFETINQEIEEADSKYKNPRNLCSGSVRQLNNEITRNRKVNFSAFSLVGENLITEENLKTVTSQLKWAKSQGFEIVENRLVTSQNIIAEIERFSKTVKTADVPTDGLVLIYNDIEYGKSLGVTAKFPRDAIAFKWKDETMETTLQEIEWSPSRTGLINPIAIFEPVELEGSTVGRASVHNVSILKELNLVPGDKIEVYKANMIIPQISKNLKNREDYSTDIDIPNCCPVCGAETLIKNQNGIETLNCPNPNCPAKMIKRFSLFASRDAMNIEGMSEATIEQLVREKVLQNFHHIFQIKNHREKIAAMEGFGEKSFDNMVKAIEKAKHSTEERLLYSLGINGIGVSNGKMIARACGYNWEKIQTLTEEELLKIDGIGQIMAASFVEFFADEENQKEISEITREVKFQEREAIEGGSKFDGWVFVITGDAVVFENRNKIKAFIENLGGKAAASVSTKTNFLINNNPNSMSSKNKKAKELGVEIITEEKLLEMGKDNE